MNATTPQGLPPQLLRQKPGMPLMLLRNLDHAQQLMNGTRMVLKLVVSRDLLECEKR